MEKDLKAQNARPLAAIYFGTLLLVAFVHWGVEETFAVSIQLGQQALVVTTITVFGGLLSNILPNYLKHSLVYWRFRNVLSGHRCRRICKKDPRLLPSDLERKWPMLFLRDMRESEQNSFWYREIYRPVRNDPEVVQAHRSFLLFRDSATGLSVLLLGLLLWKAVGEVVSIPSLNIWSLGTLLAVVVVLCLAARQCGDRMVTNATAVALSI